MGIADSPRSVVPADHSPLACAGVFVSGSPHYGTPSDSGTLHGCQSHRLGAHLAGHQANGVWESDVSALHINTLEMKAVDLALRALTPVLPRGHLSLRSDNSTVIAYINHQGGTVSPPSLSADGVSPPLGSREEFSLSALHLQGKANVLANLLSRPGTILQTEWTFVH